MRRLTILRGVLAATVVGLLALVAPVAWACDCVDMDLAESAERHPVVARVTVERAEHTSSEVVYTVTPTHVWKGNFDSAFQVRTPAHEVSCGLPGLRAGDDVLLLARGDASLGYETTNCSLTQHVSNGALAEVVDALGPGDPPELRPDLPEGELPVDEGEPDYVGATIVTTVLAVLLGVVLWQIFNRRSELRNRR